MKLRPILWGTGTFITAAAFAILYCLLTDYRITAESQGKNSVFLVGIILLFIAVCCWFSFYCGKTNNKGGLYGLIAFYGLAYVGLLAFFPFPKAVKLFLFGLLFMYATLFAPILGAGGVVFPAVMIVTVILLWRGGRKRARYRR